MQGKLNAILLVAAVCIVPIFCVNAAELNLQKIEWKDITEKVLTNPSDKPGWSEDESGKIYRDKDGSMLKIVTTDFGEFLIDLKEKTAYQVKSQENKKLEGEYTLLNRDRGKSLVLRNDEFKIRCIMDEKVTGMDNIPGIRGF